MRRIKRFKEGGEAEGLSGTAGKEGAGKKPRSIDDMSFGKAFAMKRDELGAGKTFTWRGNKYTTDLEKKQTPTAAQAKVEPKAEAPMQEVTVSTKRETQADKDRRTPGSGTGFKEMAANLGTTATREKYRAQGYGKQESERKESTAERRMKNREESAAERRMKNREESAAERRIKEGNLSFDERMKRFLARFGTQGQRDELKAQGYKKGGGVKKYNKGGKIDGCAVRGKTRGKLV